MPNPTQANSNGEIIDIPAQFAAFDDGTNAIALSLGDACNPDLDNDGLPDTTEATLGSNPLDFDSDDDRHRDGPEANCGGNPTNAAVKVEGTDSDSDLLPDACEITIGTAPDVADSDGDGVVDGLEYLRIGTDPKSRDTDGDGCNDPKETATVNIDRAVNSGDQLALVLRFGLATGPNYYWVFDLNRDGAINTIDMLFLSVYFGLCSP